MCSMQPGQPVALSSPWANSDAPVGPILRGRRGRLSQGGAEPTASPPPHPHIITDEVARMRRHIITRAARRTRCWCRGQGWSWLRRSPSRRRSSSRPASGGRGRGRGGGGRGAHSAAPPSEFRPGISTAARDEGGHAGAGPYLLTACPAAGAPGSMRRVVHKRRAAAVRDVPDCKTAGTARSSTGHRSSAQVLCRARSCGWRCVCACACGDVCVGGSLERLVK